MSSNGSLVLALLAAGVVSLAAAPADAGKLVQIKNCTEITAPGSYALKTDLPGKKGLLPGGDCLVVSADFVTIDLRGHTITGDGTGDCITDGGVARRGTAVRDGTVTGCKTGIDLNASRASLVEAVRAIGNDDYGIRAGFAARVRDCLAADNGSIGIRVLPGSVVTHSTADGNGGVGINGHCPVAVLGSVATDNGIVGIPPAFPGKNCAFENNTSDD